MTVTRRRSRGQQSSSLSLWSLAWCMAASFSHLSSTLTASAYVASKTIGLNRNHFTTTSASAYTRPNIKYLRLARRNSDVNDPINNKNNVNQRDKQESETDYDATDKRTSLSSSSSTTPTVFNNITLPADIGTTPSTSSNSSLRPDLKSALFRTTLVLVVGTFLLPLVLHGTAQWHHSLLKFIGSILKMKRMAWLGVTTSSSASTTTAAATALLQRGGGGAASAVKVAARAGTATLKTNKMEAAMRLGEKAFTIDGKFDIGRVRMRLEGLQNYSTISALLMNASLRLFSATKQPRPDTKTTLQGKHRMYNLFMANIIISILLGAYTTFVFALVSLYSKQALGRGLDVEFLNFYEATHLLRETGFRSFVSSLVSFELAFVSTLYCNLNGRKRFVYVGIASTIALLTIWMLREVMSHATTHIFS